ncbi:MAG: efflux RND transporter permease subunit [Blastocatellia bacterium]
MQKLAEICVRRPVFATMLIMTLMVLGAFSWSRLTIERFPRVEFPVITIITRLPGASPQEMETDISDKIEQAVNTISGIEELRSSSSEGVSLVMVSFELNRDLDAAAQDVRDKINTILPLLPRNIDLPTVEKLDPDASPILTLSVASNRSVREMSEYADKVLRRQLESVNGVGQVVLLGTRKRQININLDGSRLRAYNLTVNDVARALQAQNIEIPGGRVEEGARTLVLRTPGRLQSTAEFNNVVVSNRSGYAVKVSDIGYTEDGVEDEETAGLLNESPALLLNIRRQSGTNTVDVIRDINARLADVRKTMPAGYALEIVRDQSEAILLSYHHIQEHLLLGALLASIVVWLFMRNLRATTISAIAIPTSIIATFAVMEYFEITLNGPSMLGLTLSVGIVIDDAIVVLENIFRYIEEKGYRPFEAAIEGTREIGLAVMATTLSLVVIFLPVAFMQSIAGRFFRPRALTRSFAILVSLLVSFTLTPMLSSRWFSKLKRRQTDPWDIAVDSISGSHGSKDSWLARTLNGGYRWLLELSLRYRWVVVMIALGAVFSIFFLGRFVGVEFFPKDDQDEFEVNIRAAEGTSLDVTKQIAAGISREIRQMPAVKFTLTTMGDSQQRLTNDARIYIRMTPLDTRTISQFELMARVRDEVMAKHPELRSSVQIISAIGGGARNMNADVSYQLTGPDLDKLNGYSQAILDRMKKIPGMVDADTSLVLGKPELRARIDRAKATDLGVSIADIAQSLRLLVGGDQVSTFNENGEQYEVHVRAGESYRNSAAGISRLNVPSARLGSVGLDSVVQLDESTGPLQIDRYQRQRTVMLTGNVRTGVAQSVVNQQLAKEITALNLPADYKAIPAGNVKETARTLRGFGIAFLLSFIFMYIVLAAQFESFLHPITVLLALPLSLPFALVSLIVARQPLNMFTLLGLLVLFGMVKKNSILQIDHTNGLIAKGMERHEALVQASLDRLRPILMTTIAFVAGMLPLAMSTGPGAGINRSTSVVIIGGQSMCLLLTLIVTPVAYSLFDDLVNAPLWKSMGGYLSRTGRRVATATSSFLGLTGR